jgi:predicted nucleotide-binding protein (sugar kinase/HSP70/actin superfamily)
MTIGIPKALIYWKRPYFWESFFENLGFEVLLSPKTNKEIVEMGVKVADPETCFSNKVYFGHLIWLDGKCDFIFVPRLKTNFEKLEYCPKFFGIPDLAKILVKTKILTETFDERKEKFERTLQKLGKKLKKNKEEVKRATEISFLKEQELKEKEEKEFFEKIKSEKRKIVLISHPYNLYDEYVNLRMKEKLEKLGAEPIFVDEVPLRSRTASASNQRNYQRQSASTIKFHWEFGKEIMEKIEAILNHDIAGAIQISSFACGCDAVLKEFVEKKIKDSNPPTTLPLKERAPNKIPFLYLMIDEQTGEAGFQTRLEAFIDTLK